MVACRASAAVLSQKFAECFITSPQPSPGKRGSRIQGHWVLNTEQGNQAPFPCSAPCDRRGGDSLSQDQFRMPGLDHPADAVVPIYLCWSNQLAHPRQVHRYTGKGLVGIEELGFFPDQLTDVGAPLFDADRVTAPVG